MKVYLVLTAVFFTLTARAASFEGKLDDWKGDRQNRFTDPEANFKLVVQKLHEKYVDQGLTDEDLYRAATAGMLASLNSGAEAENWNVLLSPRMLEDFNIEKTGRLTGIGTVLEFDAKTGRGRVLSVLPNSAALKAGLRKDDEILSVGGEKFKGRGLAEMVYAIRGPAGGRVALKVLREDKVLSLNIVRDVVSLTEVNAGRADADTLVLTIGYFKEGTANAVAEKLRAFDGEKFKKLVIDLRGNGGGTFDDAVKVGELFLPKGAVIVRTRGRDGVAEEFKAGRDAWRPDVRLVVLTDANTSSGAELLTAALKEGRQAMTVGEATHGKWNAQSVEILPNHFAVKFSVLRFETAGGRSYVGTGIKPDLEIEGPKGPLLGELQEEANFAKRINQDAPLKAALEVASARI